MKIFKKKWLVAGVLVGMFLVWFVSDDGKSSAVNFSTEIVSYRDLVEMVSELGTVEAEDDISLSFGTGGNLERVLVKENELVQQGQVLAVLDQESVNLRIAEAEARLRAEEARLRDLRQGPDANNKTVLNESLNRAEQSYALTEQTAKDALRDAKDRVEKAKIALYSTGLSATLISGGREDSSFNSQPPVISGNYKGEKEGFYDLEFYPSGAESGFSFRYQGLEVGVAEVSTNKPIALGASGLFVTFPTTFTREGNIKWRVEIPNEKSAQYLSLKNALDSAILALQTTEAQNKLRMADAEAALNLARAQNAQGLSGVSAETIRAQEQVVSALRSSVEQVRKMTSDLEIRAPYSGIVSKVNFKVGERVNPGQEIIRLVGDQRMGVSVLVPETEIVRVKVNDPVQIKFDAILDEVFSGKVTQVSQVAVNTIGVPQFMVKISLDTDEPRLRVGMSADIDIKTDEKANVLALPSRTIVRENGEIYVRRLVLGGYQKVPVTVGLRSYDGLVEIISGVEEGDEIITYLNPNDLENLKEITE